MKRFEDKIMQAGRWSVYVRDDNKELMFTNGCVCCYAYYDGHIENLRFDHMRCPIGVYEKSLNWAKSNMVSFY